MNLKLKSQIRGGLKITKPKFSILMKKKKNSWIKKFYYTNKRITMDPKKKDENWSDERSRKLGWMRPKKPNYG